MRDYTINSGNPHRGLEGCLFSLALVGVLTLTIALVITRAALWLVARWKGLL